MNSKFPSAVPDIPVTDMAKALTYYEECLGFTVDWGRDGGGIAATRTQRAPCSWRSGRIFCRAKLGGLRMTVRA
jgi:hypothetical protein